MSHLSLLPDPPKSKARPSTTKPLAVGFLSGVSAVLLLQFATGPSYVASGSFPPTLSSIFRRHHLERRDAPPVPEGSFPSDIGSTLSHVYPPASPTNDVPSLFPTQVGFAGPTLTGAEAFVVATAAAYPTGPGVPGLVDPSLAQGIASPSWIDESGDDVIENAGPYSIFQSWSNLSPFYSVPKGAFGLKSTPEIPSGCELKGLHVLHRHGARYPGGPSGYASPATLAQKFHNHTSTIQASGPLAFLNTWTYKLGIAVLNHFGRQQMFDLGVSMRMKYGQLLEGFTNTLPIFRTESQDRMLASSTNYAFGFFGWPLDGKFLQEVTIEQAGVNNTLAPYYVCPNTNVASRADQGTPLMQQWISVYLADAKDRIQSYLNGVTLTLEDIFAMQTMCAYESTALGYSAFCPLFTQAEWEGFEYAWDVYFWYDSGPGSHLSRALGSGWVLELISRLTHTPITATSGPVNFTGNPTYQLFAVNTILTSSSTTFPLNNVLYTDATHEVVMMYIYTALNLTILGEDFAQSRGGPNGTTGPNLTKMKRASKRRWVTSRFAPFGSNMQIQLLTCNASATPTPWSTASAPTSTSSTDPSHLRIIINDAPVALTGISSCPQNQYGLCPVDTFVAAQKQLLSAVNWDERCYGNWTT